MNDDGERLQKVLAQRGWGSRRACEELIAEGRVTVNGEVAVLGRRVDVDVDMVEIDGAPVGVRPDLVYYLLNKPVHVISTSLDTHDRETVVDLVPPVPRVYSVGRLDSDSEGLLLMTNDGELTNRITHPKYGLEKEYLVQVDISSADVSDIAIHRLRNGIELDDGVTAPAEVSRLQEGVLRMVIHEGRNRQIRRMCEAVGYPVIRLVRTRIGPISDKKLRPGEWRNLTQAELKLLIEAVTE
jgi:23S rRNA pseudouridine2605 synthase